MLKTKFSLCIMCMILVFCCACHLFGAQEYVCNIDRVASIQIVRLDRYIKQDQNFTYTVFAEISDLETFVEKLNKIEHSVNGGDPGVLLEQYTVIRIEYHNGDSELIYPNAQWFYRSGEHSYGFFFFDEEQFKSLIAEYAEIENSSVS